jgi:hypothetical protein
VTGSLLLDPTNIRVVGFGGQTSNLSDVDAFTDPDIGTCGDTRVNAAAINNATANVTLQATDSVTDETDKLSSPPTNNPSATSVSVASAAEIIDKNGDIILIAEPATLAPRIPGAIAPLLPFGQNAPPCTVSSLKTQIYSNPLNP